MKKIFLFSLCLLFLHIVPARAEEILDFDQIVNVKQDGSLEVSEAITYDFDTETKHGIYRNIPFKYKARGGNYKLRLSDIKVTDSSGENYVFTVSDQGNDKVIKIGDPDKLVSGKKVYVISYKVGRAINFFKDHDEIYWNVTGNGWPVDIKQSKATIVLPEKKNEKDLKMECFAGALGSNAECVSKRFVYEGAGMVKQAVFIDDILTAGNGLTVVLGMPKGTVKEPSLVSKIADIAKDNAILALPLAMLLALLYRWYKYGRDKGGRGTIVAEFDAPDHLSPMAVGTLLDERADNKDFAANIVNLAVKGYLKIVRTEEGKWLKSADYALLKLEAGLEGGGLPLQGLEKSEEAVLSKIFKKENIETDEEKLAEIRGLSPFADKTPMVLLSGLKNKFYQDLSKIKSDVYKELTQAGYFKGNPQNIRIAYGIAGGLLIISAFPFASLGALYSLSLGVSGLLLIIFGFAMPSRTEKGSLAKEHILGLKEYLQVAEADRLKFHNAPEKNPQTFEKLLPYAMVLGVEKEWAKQFEGIYGTSEPSWYCGGNANAFSALALSDSMRAFSDKAIAASSSAPSQASSGGSGFSGGGVGGGFGGGGGGSW